MGAQSAQVQPSNGSGGKSGVFDPMMHKVFDDTPPANAMTSNLQPSADEINHPNDNLGNFFHPTGYPKAFQDMMKDQPKMYSGGKGAASPNPQQPTDVQGAQGRVTFPGQGGQPQMGVPNEYSQTINTGQQLLNSQGSWDNKLQPSSSGKGFSNGSSGKSKGH